MKSCHWQRPAALTAVVGALLVAVAPACALDIPFFGKYRGAKEVSGVVTIA